MHRKGQSGKKREKEIERQRRTFDQLSRWAPTAFMWRLERKNTKLLRQEDEAEAAGCRVVKEQRCPPPPRPHPCGKRLKAGAHLTPSNHAGRFTAEGSEPN